MGQVGQKSGVVPLTSKEPLIVLEGVLQQVLAQLAKLARVLLFQQRIIADFREVILDSLLGIAEVLLGPVLLRERHRLLGAESRCRAVLRPRQGERESGRQDQARRRQADGGRQFRLPAAPARQPHGGADRACEHGLAVEEARADPRPSRRLRRTAPRAPWPSPFARSSPDRERCGDRAAGVGPALRAQRGRSVSAIRFDEKWPARQHLVQSNAE